MRFLSGNSFKLSHFLLTCGHSHKLLTVFLSVQTGTGSTRQKKNLIVKLMRSCREKEIKFLVRTLVRVSRKYLFP